MWSGRPEAVAEILYQKLSLLFFRISSSSLLRSFNNSLPTTTAPAAVIPGRCRLFSAPLGPSCQLLSPLDFTSHYQNRCHRTECPFSVAETLPPRSPYLVIYLPGRAVDVNPPHVLATRRGYLVSAERRRGETEWDSLCLSVRSLSSVILSAAEPPTPAPPISFLSLPPRPFPHR